MKLKIKEVEEKLGVGLRRNCKVLGLDTAFKRTGWCLINSDKEDLDIDYGFIDIKGDNDYIKYNEIIDIFNNIIKRGYVVVVEDTFFGFNASGFKKISRIGAFAYALAYLKNCKVGFILASSARKKIGLVNKKKDLVHQQFKEKIDFKIEDEDIIDSIILSLSGLVGD